MDILKSSTLSLAEGQYPGFSPEVIKHDHFDHHRDVAVVLRDGVTMYVDIFMPRSVQGGGQGLSATVPAIIGWSPYGKHGFKKLSMMPGSGVDPDWVSPHALWEGPDPVFWCPQGYAIISPDPRGSWKSEGDLTFLSEQEGQDGYDLIEWLAVQDWCNGKVGLLGVSYLAASQWRIASLNPPSLAAICPWEGFSDAYREFCFHGGIAEENFQAWWGVKSRFSERATEDLELNAAEHPLFDEYWQSKAPPLGQISAPALVVASWSDQGLHTRGTLQGFEQIGSPEKWLIVHGDKKWKHFYDPANVAKQEAFFRTFLKGEQGLLDSWPKVEIEIRDRRDHVLPVISETWPLPATRCEVLFLDAADGSLQPTIARGPATAAYDCDHTGQRVVFDHLFAETTDIVGTMKLKLWVAAESATEADLFVAVQKVDRSGELVGLHFFSSFEDGPVALGWLRASLRATDPERSSLFRPHHSYAARQPLSPGEPVPVEIEIWPSGTRFNEGERLRIIIQGQDIYRDHPGHPENGHRTENSGRHIIYTGGEFDSHLTMPVL